MLLRLSRAILLFILLASFTGAYFTAHQAQSAPQSCKYYFIIYGQDWCPHCQRMEAFVKNTYGEQCLEFRDLDVKAWGENFTLIVQDLNQKYQVPVQPAFPLTGILEGGELKVIVQGEVTNSDAIDYMVDKANSQGSGWVAVFLGGQAYAIKPDSILVKAYVPQSPTETSGGGGSGSNTMLIAAGGVLIVVALVGVGYLARKK